MASPIWRLVTAGMTTSCVGIADLNGDGKLDMVVADKTRNSIHVLRNTTPFPRSLSGTLALEAIVSTAAPQPLTPTFRPNGGSPFKRIVSVGPNGAFALNDLAANAYEIIH
jgi:hypothetical protein